jgi:predicted acetyltransferase
MPDALRLIPATLDLLADYQALVDESYDSGEDTFRRLFAFYGVPPRDARAALGAMAALAEVSPRSPHVVPALSFWWVRDEASPLRGTRIVGESRLRLRLNNSLEREGGHIGYYVRVSERRRGHGRRILAATLDEARARGMARVLVTCDRANVASAHIIAANSGALADETATARGMVVQRWWITL